MENNIQILEKIGQSLSINQFHSLEELLESEEINHLNLNGLIHTKCLKHCIDWICIKADLKF